MISGPYFRPKEKGNLSNYRSKLLNKSGKSRSLNRFVKILS